MNTKRTVLIGAVESSRVALETILDQGFRVDLVCALDESVASDVSGYVPLHKIAKQRNVDFSTFTKANSPEIVQRIQAINPNFIFVIGLSQIISKDLLDCALDYAIGFHPTPLPQFRGRAAVPWLILLEEHELAISLFKIDEGMDSGDIICQHPYTLAETDYAEDAHKKILQALAEGLKSVLPSIYSGTVEFKKQNSQDATYLLIRRPEDGKIDWTCQAKEIQKLVRAASRPYPGAFSFIKGNKITVWRAEVLENRKYIGISGQIALIDEDRSLHVVVKDQILHIQEYDLEDKGQVLRVGYKLES